jgi:hypothetical protein
MGNTNKALDQNHGLAQQNATFSSFIIKKQRLLHFANSAIKISQYFQ